MFPRLDPCRGPECPQCGCRDTVALRIAKHEARVIRAGAVEEIACVTRRMTCRYCGAAWTERTQRPAAAPGPEFAEPEVTYPEPGPIEAPGRPRCPNCAAEMIVTSTRKAVRYWRCDACGATAKTPRAGD